MFFLNLKGERIDNNLTKVSAIPKNKAIKLYFAIRPVMLYTAFDAAISKQFILIVTKEELLYKSNEVCRINDFMLCLNIYSVLFVFFLLSNYTDGYKLLIAYT